MDAPVPMSADQVDGDEIGRVGDGRVAGAEGIEDRPFHRLQHRGEGQGYDDEERRAGTEDALGLLEVAATEFNGGARRAAGADQRGEGGDGQQNRETDADSRHRRIADFGDMPYEHPVDDRVRGVRRLRHDGGERHGESQTGHRRDAQP